MNLILTKFNGVYFDTTTEQFVGCTKDQFLRYLKGVYQNKNRFVNRYINVLYKKIFEPEGYDSIYKVIEEYPDEHLGDDIKIKNLLDFFVQYFDDAKPFTYKEAFELNNQEQREFQALVFTSINISEMIKELGATRIKTDGIEVNHIQYDENGTEIGMKAFHNVYETWEVSGEKLGLNNPLYAIKCWCTTTNKEHWLWCKKEFKDNPLDAIASTFVIHENLIPYIKCLKRQGDLLFVELTQNVKPEGETVSLTKEQYFNLLVAQS